MSRFTEKEKVELSRAMPAATSRIVSAPAAPRGVLQRWLRRAAVVRELSQLDDRVLADIGVQRWEIETLADQATGGSRKSLFAGLAASLFGPVVRWYRRNEAYRQLRQLDDRMLADIGISRGDINNLVRSWDGALPVPAAEAMAEDADMLRGLRLWNRSRATARALHALDNHMLDDIGLVRGDIDWVADELAQRSMWVAANRNHQPRAA